MNETQEKQFGHRIRQILNQGTHEVPPAIADRLAKAREELGIIEEQLFFQMDVLEEANTRMVVSETPLAEHEHRIARDDHARLERERSKVLAQIDELKREQDRLLDLLASKA